jgi:hypothetical protein
LFQKYENQKMLATIDILTYISEIWTLTGKHKSKLQAFFSGLFYDSVSIPDFRAPNARMTDD